MIKLSIKVALVLIIALPKNVVSQSKEKLTFNVVKEKVNITISPSYNCLYQSLPHPISIKIIDSTTSKSFDIIAV